MPDPISLRAYAKIRGCSAMAVSRAVSSGRLSRSVVRDAQGQPKIADPELADQEWAAATDLSRAPGYVKERAEEEPDERRPQRSIGADPGTIRDDMTLAEASAIEKVWKARTAELNYRQECGELVEARDIETRLVGVFTSCKTKLLGIPSRARQQDPGLTVEQIALLESLIREALEDLADGGNKREP